MRSAPIVCSFLGVGSNNYLFADLPVLLEELKQYEQTGELYDLSREDFFHPGSPIFRYPPTYAVFLLPSQSIEHRKMMLRAQPLVRASLVVLVLAVAITLAALWPPPLVELLSVLAFLRFEAWKETLGGPQLESFMVLLVALAILFLRLRRPLWAGVMLGLSGTRKVHTWGLLVPELLRRR